MAGSNGKIKGKQTELYFPDLIDSPSSYTGNSGKIISVNSNEDGLEFTDNGEIKYQYDIIIDREDYASNTDAGTALKSTLESRSYETVFITNGIYDVGTSSITLDSNIVYVEGESKNKVIFKTSSNSTGFKNFLIGHESSIKNIIIKSFGSAENEIFFDLDGTKKITLINCYADGSNKTDNKLTTIGFSGTTSNILISCYGCSGHSLNKFFYNIGLVKNTIIDEPVGENPFSYVNSVQNIKFTKFDNSINEKITTGNIKVFEYVNSGEDILFYCESDISITSSIIFFQYCYNFCNIKIDSSNYSITLGNYTKSLIFNRCENFCNIEIDIYELDFTGTGTFVKGSFINICKRFINLYILISTISYSAEGHLNNKYSKFFFNCEFFNNFYLKFSNESPHYVINESNNFTNGYVEIINPSLSFTNLFLSYNNKRFVNVEFYIHSNDNSNNIYGFNNCYNLLNCITKGNSNTLFIGFYNCKSVVSCHSHDVSNYHYYDSNGYANSYSGNGTGISGGISYNAIATSESDIT